MSDWDASRYHHVSNPQANWGRRMHERLAPQRGERILDIGCGTGRVTADLAAATSALVVGLDASAAMLTEARARPTAGARVAYLRGDGVSLPFIDAFDAVFSTATFHWILDHDRLFVSVHDALAPGGRLVAQCGGAGNLDRLIARAADLMKRDRYASFFQGWRDHWNFAGIDETTRRLETAGFIDVEVWLEPAPTPFADAAAFSEFITTVVVRHHLDRLPGEARADFVAALADMAGRDDPPYTLDYWRLNMSARKAGS